MNFELISFDLIKDDLNKVEALAPGCGNCGTGCGGGGQCGTCDNGCKGDPIDP